MTIFWTAFLILLALGFIIVGRKLRSRAGLPDGAVVYSDAARWERVSRPFYSQRLRLSGKPDYIVRQGHEIVPVEVKSRTAPRNGPYSAHIYQLAAYCALVDEHYGARPSHGLIKYADETFTVEYTDDLEDGLLGILAAMRQALREPDADTDRSHEYSARCRGCGFESICEQSLA